MSGFNFPVKDAEAEIEAIQAERTQIAEKDAELASRQRWLLQGIEMFKPTGGSTNGSATVRQPTIREAIMLVMRAGDSARAWKPSDVIAALVQRGWMPEAKSGPQMVRNRMASMVENGELLRGGEGLYSLAPDIRNTGLFRVEPE